VLAYAHIGERLPANPNHLSTDLEATRADKSVPGGHAGDVSVLNRSEHPTIPRADTKHNKIDNTEFISGCPPPARAQHLALCRACSYNIELICSILPINEEGE
jgi:hypothetical protein